MPRLTEENARLRRQQVVKAALRCFATKGLHHTSMSDILEEAGMSAGSVYSWFAGKAEIIEAAYRGSGAPHAAEMASVLEGDPLRGIGQILQSGAGMFDDPKWQMTSRVNIQLWGEALFSDQVRESFLGDFRNFRRLFADAVIRAQQEDQLDPELEPETVATVLWGLYLGMEAQKAWEPDLDTHAYAETAIALMIGR